MFSLVGQLIFDGFAMGLVFVILAGGLVLLLSVSKILFMAYGMFYTIGAYATWYAVNHFHMPYFISLFFGVFVSGSIGMLSYIFIFRRLQLSEGGFLSTLIASMGLMMILGQGGILVYGTVPRSIPNVFTGRFEWLGMTIGIDKLVLMGLGTGVILILFWIYEKTIIGRAMRAVAISPETASLYGVNTILINMLTLGFATLLAGFAGGILAPSYGINPQMGSNILWTIVLMTMLGGMDSLPGAVVGGIVIGQMLSFGQYFIGSIVQIFIFFIIGIILYFRPQGLLGRGVDIGI